MAEILNLNRARKAKAKAGDKAAAAQNRAKFGATKAERTAAAARAKQLAKTLDGAKRDE